MVVVATMLIVFVVVMLVLVMVVMTSANRAGITPAHKAVYLGFQSYRAFHSRKNLLSVKLVPRSGNNYRVLVLVSYKRNAAFNFILCQSAGMAEDYALCTFNLVVVELAEVFHVHFTFFRIDNRRIAVYNNIFGNNRADRAQNVAQLAHAGRLYNYSVRRKFIKHLFKSFAEIADQAAANTAGVHLGNLDSRVLQKSAVNAYFAELVFDQYNLFAFIRLAYELFY